jgi:hypothetical protein
MTANVQAIDSDVEIARAWFASVEEKLGGIFKTFRSKSASEVMDAFYAIGIREAHRIDDGALAKVADALNTSVGEIRARMSRCPFGFSL